MTTRPETKRQEERTKLFATALSNLGVASLVTGVIGPLFSARAQVGLAVVAFILGVSLHLLGQAMLHFVVASQEEPE